MKKPLIPLNIYKPPFNSIPKGLGFGFLGVLLTTSDGDKIQCHICGKLFKNMYLHLQKHEISSLEYKEKYQLASKTKLVSPQFIERQIEIYENLGKECIEKARNKGLKKMLANPHRTVLGKKLALEIKNQRGTCPEQIIKKIREVATKLGRTPSSLEFLREKEGERFLHLIKRTFKTWNNALRIAKLPARRKEPNNYVKYKYTEEELKEYVTIFYQEENRLPRYSDFGMGLLPALSTYLRHFGNMKRINEHLTT